MKKTGAESICRSSLDVACCLSVEEDGRVDEVTVGRKGCYARDEPEDNVWGVCLDLR